MAKDLKKLAAWGRGKKGNPPEAEQPPARTLEESCKAEVDEAAQAFRERMKREDRRRRDAVDSEYWFAVVFQNREQKDAFLREAGWWQHGDKYIDGRFAAKKLGIRLPEQPGRVDRHRR